MSGTLQYTHPRNPQHLSSFIDADERAVADGRRVLARAVVVGCDGARADVDPLADLGVAEVRHVVLLQSQRRDGCSSSRRSCRPTRPGPRRCPAAGD